MIDLDKTQLDIVKKLTSQFAPNCEVRVFGSRAKGTAKPFSDLDIALKGDSKLDWQKIERLKEALSHSDLTIMVDIVDWHDIDDSFKNIIEEQYDLI